MEYAVIFLPLIGSIVCYFGKILGDNFSQIISSLLVSISAILSELFFIKELHLIITEIT